MVGISTGDSSPLRGLNFDQVKYARELSWVTIAAALEQGLLYWLLAKSTTQWNELVSVGSINGIIRGGKKMGFGSLRMRGDLPLEESELT